MNSGTSKNSSETPALPVELTLGFQGVDPHFLDIVISEVPTISSLQEGCKEFRLLHKRRPCEETEAHGVQNGSHEFEASLNFRLGLQGPAD